MRRASWAAACARGRVLRRVPHREGTHCAGVQLDIECGKPSSSSRNCGGDASLEGEVEEANKTTVGESERQRVMFEDEYSVLVSVPYMVLIRVSSDVGSGRG